MSKSLTYIFVLYIVLLSTSICCIHDVCAERDNFSVTEDEKSGNQHDKNCDDCLPLSSCGAFSGITLINTPIDLKPPISSEDKQFPFHNQSPQIENFLSIWKPPKVS